jgi:hypothetical protein
VTDGGASGTPSAAVAPDYKEYYYVQDLVTGFNKDCLEIKKWSVAVASFVAVVGQSGLSNLSLVLLTIVALAFVFWVTETIWRMNQWAFIRSARQLEAAEGAPKVSTRWAEHYLSRPRPDTDKEGSVRGALKHFAAPRTFLPHGVIILLAGVAFCTLTAWDPGSSEAPVPQRIEGSLDVNLHGAAGSAAPAQVRTQR